MPSMVLLMRSRFRIRPFSFSIRIPSSSWYWRLILRRPASSLGRSASSSASSAVSTKLGYRPRLAVLLLRVRAIACPPYPLARARDITAVLLAHEKKPAPSVAGVHRDLALGAAAWTQVLIAQISALFRSLRFLLSHSGCCSLPRVF